VAAHPAEPIPLQPPPPAGGGPLPDAAALRAWAADLALRHFGEPFPGIVRWAPRLRYRAGDYTPSTGVIRLSVPYFVRYGAAEARAILLHELCHWWLFRRGLRHHEDAAQFQALLAAHGAPARARPLARAPRGRLRLYACPCCGALYRYRRRVAYACGHCCRRWAQGRFDERFRLRPLARTEP